MAPVTLQTPRFFHGAKLSVRQVKSAQYDFDELGVGYHRADDYGRWTDETRTVRYGATPKRAAVLPDYRLGLWDLPIGDEFQSVPYGMCGQSKLADDLDDMRDLEDDQPEPGLDALL
jgi:hypothetical protein